MVHVAVSTGGTQWAVPIARPRMPRTRHVRRPLDHRATAGNYTLVFTAPSLTGSTSAAIARFRPVRQRASSPLPPSPRAPPKAAFPSRSNRSIQLRDDGHEPGAPERRFRHGLDSHGARRGAQSADRHGADRCQWCSDLHRPHDYRHARAATPYLRRGEPPASLSNPSRSPPDAARSGGGHYPALDPGAERHRLPAAACGPDRGRDG